MSTSDPTESLLPRLPREEFAVGPALLFCPGDRPERFGKAAERADAVILDLEDAVAPADRPAAREHIAASALDPARTIVRINPVGSPDYAEDVATVAGTSYRLVMVAKTESAEAMERVAADLPGVRLIALCETAAGVLAAPAIAAHPAVIALMWGAEDLVASLGGSTSRHRDGSYRDVARHARAAVALAAGARGRAAIDAVHVDIADHHGLAAEAEDAVATGYRATACIHPGQVATIRIAYAPTDEEVDRARRLLAAAETSGGVFRHEGKMVDEPVLRHARSVLARAEK